ncbi:MAG: hypothetical protein DI539_12195 [Flavobacterium psychrophilum]|jgi:hypothetical protein|nr:MAG: hypothetical protein DI539_12195 [Flavobacterium psychrophilum]
MNDLKKIGKLVSKLRFLIERLEKNQNLIVHQKVNQFYFMQKSSELQLLHDELNELLKKKAAIENLLSIIYPEVVIQWGKDVRWLNENRAIWKAVL